MDNDLYSCSPSTCDFYEFDNCSSDNKGILEIPEKKPRKNSSSSRLSVSINPNGFTGLRNNDNTCFMNAALQVLLNTVELKTFFCRNLHFLDLNVENKLGMKGEMAAAFGQFMQDMWNGRETITEPTNIKNLISQKGNQFSNFDQHDAQEFLSFFLDVLHEDLNRVMTKPVTTPIESDRRPDLVVAELSWRNYKAREDSIIIDLFHGLLKSSLLCTECSHVSITFDPFVYLSVPFPKSSYNTLLLSSPIEEEGVASDDNAANSFLTFQCEEKPKYFLSDLLRLFTETEKLGPQEAWYCEKCKKHQEAETTMSLWNLPPLLIIQLKRFCFSANVRNKSETLVDYPVQGLDLAPYLCTGAPNQSTIYDLYAVLCHSGSVNCGHYVSYARLADLDSGNDEIDWRLFDDANVIRISKEEVVDRRAYLLFYKRRDVDSKKIFETYRNKQDLAVQKKVLFERFPHSYFAMNKKDEHRV